MPKPDPSKNPKQVKVPSPMIVLWVLLAILLVVTIISAIQSIVINSHDTKDKTYECTYSPPPQYRLLKCEYK